MSTTTSHTTEKPIVARALSALAIGTRVGLSRSARYIVSALLVALATLGLANAAPASAETLPYATAGQLNCQNSNVVGGVVWSNATVGVSGPSRFYPARYVGEAGYWRGELYGLNNGVWQQVAVGPWQSRSLDYATRTGWWNPDGQIWEVNGRHSYFVRTHFYWGTTGQHGYVSSAACYVG